MDRHASIEYPALQYLGYCTSPYRTSHPATTGDFLGGGQFRRFESKQDRIDLRIQYLSPSEIASSNSSWEDSQLQDFKYGMFLESAFSNP